LTFFWIFYNFQIIKCILLLLKIKVIEFLKLYNANIA